MKHGLRATGNRCVSVSDARLRMLRRVNGLPVSIRRNRPNKQLEAIFGEWNVTLWESAAAAGAYPTSWRSE